MGALFRIQASQIAVVSIGVQQKARYAVCRFRAWSAAEVKLDISAGVDCRDLVGLAGSCFLIFFGV